MLSVAITYDKATTHGGAEQVLLALQQLYPQSHLFTSVYNPQTASWAKQFSRIFTSHLQYLPFATKHPELYTFLNSWAFEQFDFTDYDLVISVTSYNAKSINTQPNTQHICYCLTPNRYLWVESRDENQHFGLLTIPAKLTQKCLAPILRLIDQSTSTRPDHYLAISHKIAARIQKYYRQPSQIIYPPVNTEFYQPSNQPPQDYFLCVSRLVSYKKIDLLIQTFNQNKRPFHIVGQGREYHNLKQLITSPKIKLLGFLTDEQLRDQYQHAQALIMPQKEDFGIVGLESLACGRPVISYANSGIAELLTPQTSQIFATQTTTAINRALIEFDHQTYSSTICRQLAEKYSITNFQSKFQTHIDQCLHN